VGKKPAGIVIGVVISLQSPVASQALAQAAQTATPVWSVTEGMDSPESVYYEAASGFVFSSQIGGDAAAKDGNGRIVKLTIDGKVVDTNWAKGTLNAPKGLRSSRGTLFVVDIDEVVGFEIASGREVSRVKTDAKFLNDMATAPDGTIYATDSFANRVYVVRNGVASVFVESPKLELPNGILVDGSKVIVATDGRPGRGGGGTPGSLYAVDVATKEITQITAQPIGTPDGLESDGQGGFIVADVGGGRIFHVSASGEARQIRQLDRQPADISYVPARKLLLVPHLGLNRVSAYDLSDLR
jgi:sugar lactone lactonase YvrE